MNIETCKPGDTLWFVKTANTGIETVDGLVLEEGLLFSATIKSIDLVVVEKRVAPPSENKEYRVIFHEHLPNPDGSPIHGMYFYVGEREHSNPVCFRSRLLAEARIRDDNQADTEMALEAVRRAKVILEYCENRQKSPPMVISYEAADSGFNLRTILGKEQEVRKR